MPAWLTLGAPVSTLIYNLVPVIGVLFWGWEAFPLIFLYWIENVFIGVRTFAALASRGLFTSERAALFYAAFFTVHYGIFCSVHGFFVVYSFGETAGMASSEPDLLAVALREIGANINFAAAVGAAALWQTVMLALMFARGDIRDRAGLDIMFAPYPRIVVLHVTIIASGFFLLAVGAPQAGVVLLALFKTGADVWLASRQPQRDARWDT